jgi:hypothetical protein
MPSRRIGLLLAVSALVSSTGFFLLLNRGVGPGMTEAADAFLKSLTDQQRQQTVVEFDSPKRVDWHFIPKPQRKGLQIKEMSPEQRKAAHTLLQSGLSQIGYDKATTIMSLDGILRELEKERANGPIRDPERYFFTIFGKPELKGEWGLSVEGHHLSLNFVIRDGEVVATTPTMFGANPAEVMSDVSVGPRRGTRVLKEEETLAFDLLASLSDEQRQTAVIAAQAPREIRAAGEPQPPNTAPEGLAAAKMKPEQQKILQSLIEVYAGNMPAEIGQARLEQIRKAGFDNVYFAWAGANKPGIGHYYRIQGPTFVIELVNTQPDSAGNKANHIHSVWRNLAGDFGIPR